MAEAIMCGIVSGIRCEVDGSGWLMVQSPTVTGTDLGVRYERHHAEQLLQLYVGRPVAVMVGSNGRRWIRAMSQPTVAAVVEVEAYARKVVATFRKFVEQNTEEGESRCAMHDPGDLRSIVARDLSATDDGSEQARDQCPVYCTLPQHEQLETLACVGWCRLICDQ